MLDLTFRFFAIAKVHECDLCHCPPRVTRFRTRSLRICGFLVVLLALATGSMTFGLWVVQPGLVERAGVDSIADGR